MDDHTEEGLVSISHRPPPAVEIDYLHLGLILFVDRSAKERLVNYLTGREHPNEAALIIKGNLSVSIGLLILSLAATHSVDWTRILRHHDASPHPFRRRRRRARCVRAGGSASKAVGNSGST